MSVGRKSGVVVLTVTGSICYFTVMNAKHESSQQQPSTRNIVMVIYEDAHVLDVAGPIEILTGTRLFVCLLYTSDAADES